MTQSGLGPGSGPSKPKVTLFHRLTHVLYINLNKMGWLSINRDALGRGEVSFRLIMHHEHHKSDHNVLFTGFEFSMGNNYLKF